MIADSKSHRRYNANIERALSLFDSASEWADYIAFLGRLLKAIENGKPEDVKDIPFKVKITVCLSRCLQPNLPAGVHQKALEVYNEILQTIGVGGLTRDLALYLPPLSHPLAFANLSTRPMILNLYEHYIVKVPTTNLRPALKSLILSLLPAIEEETSEDFERALAIFDEIRLVFQKDQLESYFWQSLFVASVSSPQRRAGVLVYLLRYLPKLSADTPPLGIHDASEAAIPIIMPEPGLLIRCFATALQDHQPLIQRGFLDLLVSHLPLGAAILQQKAYQKDLDVLVNAAIRIVLRKDMGLNRRLWTWLTGAESKPSDTQVMSPTEPLNKQLELETAYFQRCGAPSFVRVVRNMLDDHVTDQISRSLSFRILSSFMDKWEIASVVVQDIFGMSMTYLQNYQAIATSQAAFDEVYKSALSFFESVETPIMLGCMEDMLANRRVDLLAFIVANFNISTTASTRTRLVNFCTSISREMVREPSYQALLAAALDNLSLNLSSTQAQHPDADRNECSRLLKSISDNLSVVSDKESLTLLCASFERAALMLPPGHEKTISALVEASVATLFHQSQSQDHGDHFESVICARLIICLLVYSKGDSGNSSNRSADIVETAIVHLWPFLAPDTPQSHIATVEILWRFHDLVEPDLVESAILAIFENAKSRGNTIWQAHVDCWTTFYQHSRTIKRSQDDHVPALLSTIALRLLDSVDAPSAGDASVVWLSSIPSITPILKAILSTQNNEDQFVALTVTRLHKLLSIMQRSDNLRKVFYKSPDLDVCHAYCMSIISPAHENASINRKCLQILVSLYNEQSGITAPEEFVAFLVGKLEISDQQGDMHEMIVDALLSVLNDKTVLPPSFTRILLRGLDDIPSDGQLEKWVTLLCNFLPHHVSLLPNLLKVTSSLCDRIDQTFDDIRGTFDGQSDKTHFKHAERLVANLLSGLEYILARAHQLVHSKIDNAVGTPAKDVSSRALANDRLTVTLCMQDAIRICTRLWSWKPPSRLQSSLSTTADIRSFQYAAMKLRGRCRRILDNLIEAEPQDCLETLMESWNQQEQNSVLELLQTLHGARPGVMLPVIFSAVHNRISAAVPSTGPKATLTIQLRPYECMAFLMAYTSALEDDMLEEIWSSCVAFCREILANPMQYRQVLLPLLEFEAGLAKKLENTNFGEDSRKYRELADVSARLFTAIHTVKPSGHELRMRQSSDIKTISSQTNGQRGITSDPTLQVLAAVMPVLAPVLVQFNQSTTVYQGLIVHFISPAFHSRAFPTGVYGEHLQLMQLIASSSGNAKLWRKEIIDAIGNPSFFQSDCEIVKAGWLPLLNQLASSDKSLITDCLTRMPAPAAAGIMFGVGAAAARTEADRKTQLEIRRIILIMLSLDIDAMLPYMKQVMLKIEELITATPESSPSMATRGDVFMLFRALVLQTSHSSLAGVWPVMDQELQALCTDVLRGAESIYTSYSKLQGAKLLDLLLLLRPDEFQLQEWLFVTDTIDAIYPPNHFETSSFADRIAPILAVHVNHSDSMPTEARKSKKPWLCSEATRHSDQVESLLADFFGQLSIRSFEDLYSLQPLDIEACRHDLLADLLHDDEPLI